MDHLDSKAIESFMIPKDEIATEGLLGGIVLSIVLLPYVLIGGFMIVMGASVANENRKMRKEIKLGIMSKMRIIGDGDEGIIGYDYYNDFKR